MCRECGNRTMSLVDGNTFGKPNGGALYRVVDKWNRRAGQEGEQNEKDL